MGNTTAGLVAILRKTLPWVRLLSIAGFIAVGFFALLGSMSLSGLMTGSMAQRIPVQSLVLYPAMMLLAFIPAWHLRKCARRMQVFVAQGHIVQLEGVLESQRAVWKFAGLLALLAAAVAVAAMVLGVLAAL